MGPWEVIGIRLGHEGKAFMMGLMGLEGEQTAPLPPPTFPCKDEDRSCEGEVRRQDPHLTRALIVELPASRAVRDEFLLLRKPSL